MKLSMHPIVANVVLTIFHCILEKHKNRSSELMIFRILKIVIFDYRKNVVSCGFEDKLITTRQNM